MCCGIGIARFGEFSVNSSRPCFLRPKCGWVSDDTGRRANTNVIDAGIVAVLSIAATATERLSVRTRS